MLIQIVSRKIDKKNLKIFRKRKRVPHWLINFDSMDFFLYYLFLILSWIRYSWIYLYVNNRQCQTFFKKKAQSVTLKTYKNIIYIIYIPLVVQNSIQFLELKLQNNTCAHVSPWCNMYTYIIRQSTLQVHSFQPFQMSLYHFHKRVNKITGAHRVEHRF